jgi:two-component system, chemotaxis family, chemotaxis protein CheY
MNKVKKILLVDDSIISILSLKNALIEEGFDVLEAQSGHDGFNVVKDHPDLTLIITDIHMNDLDGLSMVELIKARDNLKNIPIFVVSTEFNEAFKDRGRKLGVRAWIRKPVDAEKLTETILKFLG